jgi:hypothetical protein
MFAPPHDHRIIIEVTLDTAAYHDARRHFGTSALFTLAPEPFPIHDLKPGADGRPALTEFSADLFFGHFERGGDRLGRVAVTVERTLVFRHFEPTGKTADLGYLLFGGGDELFLAHEVTAPPDFDQLLTVQISMDDAAITPGQAVDLRIPGRTNGLDTRLSPGEQVDAAVTSNAETATSSSPPPPATLGLQAIAEVYLETADLAE